MDRKDLVDVRDAQPSDVNFIFATWLKGLRYGNSWFELIPSKIYFTLYHKVLEKILSRPGVRVKVACLKEDPEVILGYSVIQGSILHWVQVKSAWRQIGVARSLVPSQVTTVTHITKSGAAILNKKNMVFNPFLA